MKTVKAVRVIFEVGDTTLDGYQKPDGTYSMSRNGLVVLGILIGDSTGKKYAKPILEADKSSRELTKIQGQSASAKLMSLETFSAIVLAYAEIGNEKCKAIIFACFAESIERRLDNAFGKIRTEEERNERLKNRQSHREDFHPKFTAWLKLDGCEGTEYAIRVNEFKRVLGLPISSVDEYDSKELRKLDVAYIKYDVLRTTGLPHSRVLELI
ncbi:MAG: hypothetical protein ACEQSC_00665 [Candidatus Nanopelagicaceae bacterium]